MIKVNTNPQVIQLYIDQAFPEATNRQKSLWFKGTKLYSYDSLLAIIDPANNIVCIDSDIRHYSNTTSKQTALLCSRATRSNYIILSLPLETLPEQVIMYYWNKVEYYIAKYLKARVNQSIYKERIHIYLNQAELYANYTQINKKSKEYKYRTKLIKQLFEYQIL